MAKTEAPLLPPSSHLDKNFQLLLAEAAEDLELLARFHDRELDADFLDGLRQHALSDWFGLTARDTQVSDAAGDLDLALALLPSTLDQKALDVLAAEFADIYLCHNYRIAPTGSVWLTEERLERQEPMFAVRKYYAKYGINVPDWRLRSDDHIVHELQFLAYLCELATMQSATDAAHFLDQNMLNWIPDFTRAIAERAKQPIYIASAKLTLIRLEELRGLLEAVTDIGKPADKPETRKNVVRLIDVDLDRPFVPGTQESW